jgi:hypothetical protein
MAILLVHWLSWSWSFLSAYDVIHFLHVRIHYSSFMSYRVVRLHVVALFLRCLVTGRLESIRAIIRLVKKKIVVYI